MRLLRSWTLLAAFGLALAGVLGWCMPRGWVTELFRHFPLYWSAGWLAVAGGLACGWRGRRAPFWLAASLALTFLALWATPRLPVEQPQFEADARLRIVWANLQHDPRHVRALLDVLAELDPPVDVLGVAEVYDADALQALRAQFPHGLVDRAAGVALLGRAPFAEQDSVLGLDHRPILRARWQRGTASVDLFGMHALLPLGEQPALDRVAELAAACTDAVLIGDLNTTPWSAAYARLLGGGGLRDARRGHWPRATWRMAGMPWMRLPIDHALVRGAVRVEQWRVLDDVGSDHLPFLVELALPGARGGGH